VAPPSERGQTADRLWGVHLRPY